MEGRYSVSPPETPGRVFPRRDRRAIIRSGVGVGKWGSGSYLHRAAFCDNLREFGFARWDGSDQISGIFFVSHSSASRATACRAQKVIHNVSKGARSKLGEVFLIMLWSKMYGQRRGRFFWKANPPVIRPARPCLGQAQPSSRGDVAGNFSKLAKFVEVWHSWPSTSQVLLLTQTCGACPIGRA